MISEVHRVKLSRSSCIIKVLSLYDSSPNVSSSEIASSKACQMELLADKNKVYLRKTNNEIAKIVLCEIVKSLPNC